MFKKEKLLLDDSFKEILDCKINSKRLPLVYRKEHNISFMGFEKLHSFDSCKFANIASNLKKFGTIPNTNVFIKGKIVKPSLIEEYHEKEYLDSLKNLKEVGRVIELDLQSIVDRIPFLEKLNPMKLVDRVIINGFRYQVGSVVLAGEVALKYGWSIVLGGGMHHASAGKGGGWCMFGDIQMSLMNLKKQSKVKNAFIIDLDAHQGNGHERDKVDGKLGDFDETYIMDVYHKNNYPGDNYAKQGMNIDEGITRACDTKQYLKRVKRGLVKMYEKDGFRPDIVFYNAGSDCLVGDPLGRLAVSEEGIIARDYLVFKYFLQRKIPVVYLTSGGYTARSVDVVSRSIDNMFNRLHLREIAQLNYQRNLLGKVKEDDPVDAVLKKYTDDSDEKDLYLISPSPMTPVRREVLESRFEVKEEGKEGEGEETEKYEKQIKQLREMGFIMEDVFLRSLLEQNNGSVEAVLGVLLS